jgi:hypothetical protein
MDQARFLPIYAPDPRTAESKFNVRSIARQSNGRYRLHGVTGAGELPFFQGVTGAGELPFLHGVTGAGEEPFAIIMLPSLCAITTVFKPIAPTKTSMARNRTTSFLDMLPPGMNDTQRHFIPI